MGKPAATDRPCLTPLSHSFTLDLQSWPCLQFLPQETPERFVIIDHKDAHDS